MVNTDKLKAVMQAKSISIEKASNVIGIDPSTFYRRIQKNGEKFTVSEVTKLADMLKIDSKTLQSIFFAK